MTNLFGEAHADLCTTVHHVGDSCRLQLITWRAVKATKAFSRKNVFPSSSYILSIGFVLKILNCVPLQFRENCRDFKLQCLLLFCPRRLLCGATRSREMANHWSLAFVNARHFWGLTRTLSQKTTFLDDWTDLSASINPFWRENYCWERWLRKQIACLTAFFPHFGRACFRKNFGRKPEASRMAGSCMWALSQLGWAAFWHHVAPHDLVHSYSQLHYRWVVPKIKGSKSGPSLPLT